MISLSELLANDVEVVLKTPLLRQAVISYTRNLFYGGSPVSSCDSSCRTYFRKLQTEGTAKQKKLAEMKYQLKPETIIVFNGQAYNNSTITDKIAEDYLQKFPKGVKNFVQPKTPLGGAQKPESPKEKLLKRANELGIETNNVSEKKLKDAIAEKELALQAKEKEELVLKAIELGVENAEDLDIEALKAKIAESNIE
jgi:hypothetical protein